MHDVNCLSSTQVQGPAMEASLDITKVTEVLMHIAVRFFKFMMVLAPLTGVLQTAL